MKADPSFDLDGDGAVSMREFLIATRFDKNQDGRLDSRERAACMEALKGGYEDQLLYTDGPARSLATRV